MKYEEIYLNEYRDATHLKWSLKMYVHFYNTERPHQSLDYRTPENSTLTTGSTLPVDHLEYHYAPIDNL